MDLGNSVKMSLTRGYLTIFYIIHRLLALVEFFLFLRLALKFLGANPAALVVNLIYKYSAILVSPFESIFPNIYWPAGYLVETATLSAMVGYALAVYIICQILRLFSQD